MLFSMSVSSTHGKAVSICADHLPGCQNWPVVGNKLLCEDTHRNVCIFLWPSPYPVPYMRRFIVSVSTLSLLYRYHPRHSYSQYH